MREKNWLGVRMALSELVMMGTARSETKVSWRVLFVVAGPSVTDSDTAKLPSEVAVPEISPVIGLMLNPGGRPPAVNRADELAFFANT